MSELKKYEFWFVTGAQKLYGDIFQEMVDQIGRAHV